MSHKVLRKPLRETSKGSKGKPARSQVSHVQGSTTLVAGTMQLRSTLSKIVVKKKNRKLKKIDRS